MDTLIHSTMLKLYTTLFEGSYGEMEVLPTLEIKKMLEDRLVNLLSRGYLLTQVKYIDQSGMTRTDIPLIQVFFDRAV